LDKHSITIYNIIPSLGFISFCRDTVFHKAVLTDSLKM